jgi:mRNA interferase YafQ
MTDLENGEQLPAQNKDHSLSGFYLGYRECHIQPDWLLVYQANLEIIVFDRTGTHSD